MWILNLSAPSALLLSPLDSLLLLLVLGEGGDHLVQGGGDQGVHLLVVPVAGQVCRGVGWLFGWLAGISWLTSLLTRICWLARVSRLKGGGWIAVRVSSSACHWLGD